MRKGLLKFSFRLIFIGLISSCNVLSSSDEAVYMAFEDVEYVSSFPVEVKLNSPEEPSIDYIGLREVRIVGNLLILGQANSNGLWQIYRLPDYEYLGGFLKRGDGPLEFMQGPSLLNKLNFENENGQLVVYIYDFQKGRVMKFNLSESLETGKEVLSPLESKVPPFLFSFTKVDQDVYLIKEIKDRDTRQVRSLVNSGNISSLSVTAPLDNAAIKQGEDFNILSALLEYNSALDRVVEAPIGLNHINIYSLKGDFSKSICLEDKLSDIVKIQSQFRFNRNYTFADLRLFDEFFGVIFINEDELTYQNVRKKIPSILFFDYDGRPLAKIQTGSHFTSFDIDFNNQKLYTFDVHSDEFLKFDIKEVLEQM